MPNTRPSEPQTDQTPGLLRRLAAMLYDGLLLLGLIMVATALVTLPFGMPSGLGRVALQLLLFGAIPLFFFCGFWVRAGQTLGMRAWKLVLIGEQGRAVRWRDALIRYFAALLSWLALGLGFLWVLVDAQGLAWHDRLSKTRLRLNRDL
jgi:uncharacterized RDD family membrane protein YckC